MRFLSVFTVFPKKQLSYQPEEKKAISVLFQNEIKLKALDVKEDIICQATGLSAETVASL